MDWQHVWTVTDAMLDTNIHSTGGQRPQEARALPEFGWVGTGLEIKEATHSGACIVRALGPRGEPCGLQDRLCH